MRWRSLMLLPADQTLLCNPKMGFLTPAEPLAGAPLCLIGHSGSPLFFSGSPGSQSDPQTVLSYYPSYKDTFQRYLFRKATHRIKAFQHQPPCFMCSTYSIWNWEITQIKVNILEAVKRFNALCGFLIQYFQEVVGGAQKLRCVQQEVLQKGRAEL